MRRVKQILFAAAFVVLCGVAMPDKAWARCINRQDAGYLQSEELQEWIECGSEEDYKEWYDKYWDGSEFDYVIKDDGTITIIAIDQNMFLYSFGKYYGKSSISITVPEKINGRTVTEIGNGAFTSGGCESVDITKIKLPATITKIGRRIIKDEDGITVNIPRDIKEMSPYAFSGCTIKKLTFDKGVTMCPNFEGDGLWDNAAHIKGSVTIPGTVKTIPSSAFYGSSITTLKIEEGVTKIGDLAFALNSLKKGVTLPTTLKTIDDNAFNGTRITSIVVPKNVTCIGAGAFADCTKLIKVTIKSSKSKIWWNMVTGSGNSKLNTNVTIYAPKSKIAAYKKVFAEYYKTAYNKTKTAFTVKEK